MEEIFKSIQGYEGLYEVSNLGRVKSLWFGSNILKPWKNNSGYLLISLTKGKIRTRRTIHELVAETFLGPRPNGYDIDHIDHNPQNNRLDNLRYLPVYNNRREGGKSNSKKVLQYTLDGEFVKEWASLREVERQTGFSNASLSKCCNGKLKYAYGHTWQYA